MQAYLILENGTVFQGETFGAVKEVCGEVVFNTAITGYQEILSDPSYKGQMVCLTYPLIGNYGVNEEDLESSGTHLSGLIVREYSSSYSNWRGYSSLESLMRRNGITGIREIDTRALTHVLREQGSMKGIITTSEIDKDQIEDLFNKTPDMEGSNYVEDVSSSQSYVWQKGQKGEYSVIEPTGFAEHEVVVLDCGVKFNILESLAHRNCRVTVLPSDTGAKEILEMKPNGLLLSNGPGDPASLSYIVDNIKALLGKVPVFGICLGHQLLGTALGATTYKLSYGHHGANHPVKNHLTGRAEITSQNHGFALDPETIPENILITHTSLYDGTVEGILEKNLSAFSVQFHPEASPGPRDCDYLFDNFKEMMAGWANA